MTRIRAQSPSRYEDAVRVLQRIPLFAVTPAALDALARAAVPRTYSRGDVALPDSDSGSFVLHTGRARVVHVLESGEQITVEVIHPLDVWGLTFASEALGIRGDLSVTSTKASGYYIPRWAGRQLCTDSPGVLARVLELVGVRWVAAQERIRDLAVVDVEGRVAIVLALEVLHTGSTHITMTQDEQASLVGTSREQVTRAHDRLRGKGYIEASPWERGVIVRDPEHLLELYRR